MELERRRLERQPARLPLGAAVLPDVEDGERRRLRRSVAREDAHLGARDEGGVVVVRAELHRRQRCVGARLRGDLDRARAGRHAEAPLRAQVVEAEADVGFFEGHVGAALHVGRAAARVVDRNAVDRDAHQVEPERVLRPELAVERDCVDARVVVQHRELVVHDVDLHVGGVALDEARVHHVVRAHVAAALVLDLCVAESELGGDLLHRALRARGRETDVVAVDDGGAPVEALAAGAAHEAQSHLRLVADLVHRDAQPIGVARGDRDLAVLDHERLEGARRRIVDLGHDLGAGVARAELRLVGQLLQRIVVPELDLDPAVQRAAAGRVGRREQLRGAAALARDRRGRQVERILRRERDAVGHRLRQRERRAVDPLGAAAERQAVGEADELHDDVLLAVQVLQRLAYLLDERLGDVQSLFVEVERWHQVLHTRAPRLALQVPQLADLLDATDLDLPELGGDDHLLRRCLALALVVPDLDLDPAVLRAALRRVVARDRRRVARPLEGHRLGRKSERVLEELRDLARALAREARVVAVHLGESLRERLRVRVADQVQPHVRQIAHPVEHAAQLLDGAGRDVRGARTEVDRRHHVLELHDLRLLACDLALLEHVA